MCNRSLESRLAKRRCSWLALAVLWATPTLGVLAAYPDGKGEPPAWVLAKANEKAELPFQVPSGFVAELVAGPPLVEYPMHACFDDRGRLFVADSLGINPKGDLLGKNPVQVIRLLEDTQRAGHFDKFTIYADKLVFPEGVCWHDDSIFTASPPSLWRLDDTQGTGKADRRRELITGFPNTGIADDLHGPTVGPDGRLYWSCGRFRHEIRQPAGEVLWKGRAPLVLRCRPDGSEVEIVSGAQGNAVKVAFTPEGEPLACGTWGRGEGGRQDMIIHCLAGGNYPMLDGDFFSPEFKHTDDILPPVVFFGPASAAGVVRYRGGAFGIEYQGNLFSVLFNMHKVQRHILERDGATFRARTEDFLVSQDPNFRPTDVIEDADGSLLVVNTGTWSACCEAFRAGGQPKAVGGIYRIRRLGAGSSDDPRGLKLNWDRLTDSEVAGRLDDPRFAVRDRAVAQFAKQGVGAITVLQDVVRNSPSVRARRNAVWALARIDGAAASAALMGALADKDPSVRLTATYAVGLRRESGALPKLMELVKTDESPIRREAATALGRLQRGAAVPALFEALRAGGDRFLEHALIYALIVIGDRDATLKGLADGGPQVRRGALIALDQMDKGDLTPDLVTPLLNTDDKALQKTALGIITHRPGCANEIVGLLREWLSRKEIPPERQESLRGALLAFCRDEAIQQLVGQTIHQPETPLATRLLLLETMARASLERLPDSWVEELGQSLKHPEEKVVHQAVATIQAARVTRFDDDLIRLAKNKDRPADLRVAALAAAETRLPKLELALFEFLVGQLDSDMSPFTRLTAAACLGDAPLDDGQLVSLAQVVGRAGPLEMPHLAAAYERSRSGRVGQILVEVLAKAPGLQSVSPETLARILRNYPADIHQAAKPLFKRLEADIGKQKTRLAEMEPVLSGGKADKGREVFFGKKAACSTCHTVQSQGGQVGPDLSKIGAIRSGHDLLVAIIFPSASFARGYEPYVVTTRSGKFYPAGILRRETAEAIYLTTSDRAEIRIARSEIETIEPGRVSIMPEGLDTQLSKQELADLIAFLQSLK